MSSTSTARRSGILLVDKPGGMTSHDVVSRVRKLVGTRKVGHAGTLDPMATGLLVVGVNSSTRLLTFLVGLDKEYLATVRLGEATATDDADGEIVSRADAAAVTDEEIREAATRLTGTDISQVPSSYSAVRVAGRHAYEHARAGAAVRLAARTVSIRVLDLIAIRRAGSIADVETRVACSSGTYVRAIARDLGTSLGVGGHLIALRRTRVGPFEISDAVELDDLDPPARLRTPAEVATKLFPSLDLDASQVIDLRNGKRLPVAGHPDGGPVAALGPDGHLVGLVGIAAGLARTIVNFPEDEAP